MSQNCEKQLKIEKKVGAVGLEQMLADVIKRYLKNDASPVLIAIGGAGGTGKSTFSKKLASALESSNVLHLDDYKTCRHFRKERGIFGPHPEANEMDLISEHLAMIKSNVIVDKPVYCPEAGRATKTEQYTPEHFNIIEGEVSTYNDFADIIDFHIFIDADLETQLQTRMSRDVHARGYTVKKALETFMGSNITEFKKYGSETKAWADTILFCDKDYLLTIREISSSLHDYFV